MKKLLTSIYQNTQTAMQSIDNILPGVKNDRLVAELKRQYGEYKSIAKECEVISKREGYELPDNNMLEKMRLWSSIKMSTLTDKTTEHITEMMMFGTLMGIIQVLRDCSDYAGSAETALGLLKRLQTVQESNLETLKKFI